MSEATSNVVDHGEMSKPVLVPGVFPDFTAGSIFFERVTSHMAKDGVASITFEVGRSGVSAEGSLLALRSYAGVLRCSSVEALRQLKRSVDALVFAAEAGLGGHIPN